MKKIYSTSSLRVFLSLVSIMVYTSINAQIIEVYKNDGAEPIATYTTTATDNYKIVFEEGYYSKVLPGKFTVKAAEGNNPAKQVMFTKGNLYWDGSAFKFEANQTDYPSSWGAGEEAGKHVGHFYWSKTASVMYAPSHSESETTQSDIFFFSEANKDNEANKVDGVSGYFALNWDEWSHLLTGRNNASRLCKHGVSVTNNGTTYENCIILAPDGFTGELQSSYTLDDVNSLGLVCLPAAGYRSEYSFEYVGSNCDYWTSTTAFRESWCSISMQYKSGAINFYSSYRRSGQNIRLVVLAEN